MIIKRTVTTVDTSAERVLKADGVIAIQLSCEGICGTSCVFITTDCLSLRIFNLQGPGILMTDRANYYFIVAYPKSHLHCAQCIHRVLSCYNLIFAHLFTKALGLAWRDIEGQSVAENHHL